MAWHEIPGSPIEQYSLQNGWTITRKFVVDWADRFTLIDELLSQRVYPPQPAASISDFSFEHIGQDPLPTNGGVYTSEQFITNTLEYSKVMLTATYTSAVNATNGSGGGGGGGADNTEARDVGGIFQYDVSGSQEMFTRESRSFKWASDANLPVPADVRPLTVIALVEHRLSMTQLSTIAWDLLESLTGCVNKFPLRMPVTGRIIHAETLLFGPYSVSVEIPRDTTYSASQLKWRADLNLVQRIVAGSYSISTSAEYDALGTLVRTGGLSNLKHYYQWLLALENPGSIDYDTTLFIPPGWNSYIRDVVNANTTWTGWDYLVKRDPEVGETNITTYTLRDFNTLIYGYAYDTYSGAGNTLMNSLYPDTVFGAW